MSKISLVYGSCVDQNVDAIVNAANRNLWSGGGVCGAIFKKAGYEELNRACSDIETPLKDGDAVITPAFNISNANHIIHAVGPDFRVTPNAFDKLYLAYFNSLVVLKENELRSIAFPLISSGIFGYGLDNPSLESAKLCISAYNDFVNKYGDYDIDVLICAYSGTEMNILQNELKK